MRRLAGRPCAGDRLRPQRLRVVDAAAAVGLQVGVEHLPPQRHLLRHSDPVAVPDHGREVRHRQELRAVLRVPQEGEDVVLGGVRLHPGEALRHGVPLPEGGRRRVGAVQVAHEGAHALVVTGRRIRGVQQPPVRPVGLRPLRPLGELLPHEQQLLAGMGPHEAEVGPVRGPLLPPVAAGHLRHQRSLAVHHLVVRDRQDVVLAEGVDHPEGHVVVVVLAVHRLLRHVAQRVVHPAHVPLQAEAEPAGVRRPGHPRPGRGLLRDGHHARAAPVHGRVHLLEQRHRVQVLPAAVLVGRPLALAARVVEVEHRGHRVHPQPVHVELLAPVHGVGDEEVADLLAAVVELQRPPVRVRGPARVLVLVQRPPVELRERPLVAREVRGHPVDDHPDPGPVQRVHQETEVVRGAHPRGRRVEPGDLVAPGAAEGVLGDRHHLHVREAQLLDVRGELLGELPVGQPRPPRRQVQFVHREGRLVRRSAAALRHPPRVLPLVPGGGDHRRVRRGTSADRAIGSARRV